MPGQLPIAQEVILTDYTGQKRAAVEKVKGLLGTEETVLAGLESADAVARNWGTWSPTRRLNFSYPFVFLTQCGWISALTIMIRFFSPSFYILLSQIGERKWIS
jgi:hypothetical protein